MQHKNYNFGNINQYANENTIGLDGNQNVILENKLNKRYIIQSQIWSDAIVFGTVGTVAIGAGFSLKINFSSFWF